MSELDSAILRTIIDTAHDHFFVVDASGQVRDVSPGAAAVYGMSCEALRGSNVRTLVEQGVLKPSVSLEVIRTGKPAQLLQHTGTGRRVVAQAHPVFSEGRLACVVSRSMDLTDLQLLQEEYALLQQRFSDHLKRSVGEGAIAGEQDPALAGLAGVLEVRSSVMQEIALLLKRVAPTDANVLMLGESGVGKTAFARQLHRWSARGEGPFIDVNCGAIPESLFESEMFGYQPGAFSGSNPKGKAGLLEQAAGGTLFLDEIGELPLAMQTKLLKVIQDGSLMRLGDTTPRRVDFRLVVATNQNLAEAVEEGRFRLDLYYRLNVIPVTLPPLRERREDIPGLVERQLKQLNRRYGGDKILDSGVWQELMGRDWPGNVRELENWLERAWLSAASRVIATPEGDALAAVNDLSVSEGPATASSAGVRPAAAGAQASRLAEGEGLKEAMARIERDILASLCGELGSSYAIAERLGISQPSVVRKMQRHGLRIRSATER
ncbi:MULTISPECIES: sigma-54 interaction domain-containing protein [Halomonadaceae]|uniref:sigma-54 interaction domain-containing protein n=1 Tax=Halomonadaceae TaxID=28256 RepID=UPI0015832369|nr:MULTISPECIES: sigma 54-interacting transcriptional regulator [Halomonas]MDI4636284.1 sigma 54-interacting transcriptional regulator [Halomonas sp. BMC7]NUJ60647.1 sigma 54-interacting transcriptional regulator [Halomonas taeanensis]|tara:strand:+ start:31059 stop:32534 length:1476 start_codon:yes stop_codon:yes gene_type:complete